MKNQDAIKLTREEQEAALAAFTGTVRKIPTGKRTTRGPSKKPGESGSLQGSWGDKQERWAYGD
jgi:hypothetical protein